jgi:hypothetical protein
LAKLTYPRLKMEYNIEKIDQIGWLLAEIMEEALEAKGEEGILIGEIAMTLQSTL